MENFGMTYAVKQENFGMTIAVKQQMSLPEFYTCIKKVPTHIYPLGTMAGPF